MSATIRTEGGDPTGTFRVYEGDTHIGYVLTMHQPGEGPDWSRPLGRQGLLCGGTWAAWAPTRGEAITKLVETYHDGQP